MNKIYKVIWSSINKCWIAVSELSKTMYTSTLVKTIVLPSVLLTHSFSASSLTFDDGQEHTLEYTLGRYGQAITNIPGALIVSNGSHVGINEQIFNIGEPYAFNTNGIIVTGTGSLLKLVPEGYIMHGIDMYPGPGLIQALSGGEIIFSSNYGSASWSTLADNNGIIRSLSDDNRINSTTATNGGKIFFTNIARQFTPDYNDTIYIDGIGSEVSGPILSLAEIGEGGKAIISNKGELSFSEEIIMNKYRDIETEKVRIIIGGEDTPQTPGYINTPKIHFGSSDSSEWYGDYSGIIQFNHTSQDYTFNTPLYGQGNLLFTSGTTILSGDNSQYSGNITVEKNGTTVISEKKNINNANLQVDGKFQINNSSDWVFDNVLSGTGSLEINTGHHSFSFKNTDLTQGFTGILALSNSTFELNDDNTGALSSATLQAGTDSMITVGEGIQNIGGLSFSGGTVNFDGVLPGQKNANHMITVSKNLHLTGDGTIQIDNTGVINITPPDINTTLPLLEQDSGNALIKLVGVTNNTQITGKGGNLVLKDLNGNIISDNIQHDIVQNTKKVAEATYDYRLTTGENNDGLYIGYGLTQLNLKAFGKDALILNAEGKTGNDADMSARITGNGDLAFNSPKGQSVSLSNRNNDYSGVTDIRSGNLLMNNDNVLGKTRELRLATDTILDMNGYTQTVGNLINNGLITTGSKSEKAGNLLTVTGDYTSNNGTLVMNTVLGGDNSATDKLVIKGNASGDTLVTINNIGGSGNQTLNGIELIHVDGNSASADFIQNGRIAAGAYDYHLGRGEGANNNNWYLTSNKNSPDPIKDNDLRPEANSYIANSAAANTLFITQLNERQGNTLHTSSNNPEKTSLWIRQTGGHSNWRNSNGQLKTQSNRYVIQLGGDVAQWSLNDYDRLLLGLMAGYGYNHSNTVSSRTGLRSDSNLSGYNVGVYATWYADADAQLGTYVDTWALYNRFSNHVNGQGLPGQSWTSDGFTVSAETGYTHKISDFTGSLGSTNQWYIQPQAQITWMGVKSPEFRESNGTRIRNQGDGNIRTRLGIRTWIEGHHRSDDGKSRTFRPFAELSWIHNSENFSTLMDGVTVRQGGTRNTGELRLGLDGQLNTHLSVWGSAGVQLGDNGYNDTSATLGIKYSF